MISVSLVIIHPHSVCVDSRLSEFIFSSVHFLLASKKRRRVTIRRMSSRGQTMQAELIPRDIFVRFTVFLELILLNGLKVNWL